MNARLLTAIFLLLAISAFAQQQDTWIVYWNNDTTLMGFKDSKGNVRIAPKFRGFTSAIKFDGIIGVTEQLPDTFYHYYLTWSGKIIGRDSLLDIDNAADCENEGFIRYTDRKTDGIGMFNKNGDIVIPAVYNWLGKARNGMVVALKDARKVWLDDEHWAMKGGRSILIDTNNTLLLDSFVYDDLINFYSVMISPKPSGDSIRRNFKTITGLCFSFIDYEKEFRKWLADNLPEDLQLDDLLKTAFDEITYYHPEKGWIQEPKKSLIEQNFDVIKKQLQRSKETENGYSIFHNSLNPFIFQAAKYDAYFDNCRNAKEWMYPVFSVYEHTKDQGQITLDFLRTQEGYKLISLDLQIIK